jgi:hypothetical protein
MKCREKPLFNDFIVWTGDNLSECIVFLGKDYEGVNVCTATHMSMRTFKGIRWACAGDYIMRGAEGDHYPVKPEVWNKTYEQVFQKGGFDVKTYTRLDKIQKSKGFFKVEHMFAIVLLLGLGGYIANIVKVFSIGIAIGHWGGMEVIRVIGVFIPPLGAILGYC